MATLECGKALLYNGKDRATVQKDVDAVVCSTDKTCEESGSKVECSKRTLVEASKEDPKLFLGFVWCPCPKELPKTGEVLRIRPRGHRE